MLSKSTLAEVLAMDLQQLHTSFPWMPVKIVKVKLRDKVSLQQELNHYGIALLYISENTPL